MIETSQCPCTCIPVLLLRRTATPPSPNMSTSSSPTPRTFTEAWLPGHDGTKFYTRTYPAPSPRAVLLFVHGFAEHLGRYEWAHGEYASQGITVFTYDQRGFGRTALDHPNKSKHSAYGKTSWPDQLSDIEFWVKHLKSEYSELPLFLKGHSMVSAFPDVGRAVVNTIYREEDSHLHSRPGQPRPQRRKH